MVTERNRKLILLALFFYTFFGIFRYKKHSAIYHLSDHSNEFELIHFYITIFDWTMNT